MKQLTFYKYATIALIVLNLLIVSFFIWIGPKGKPGKHNPINTHQLIGFDKEQNDAFQKIAEEHRLTMDQFDKEQIELLKPYFQSLYDSSFEVDEDSLLKSFERLEGAKVQSTYDHFKDVHSIVRPEQQEGYEEFVKQTIEVILGQPSQNRPPQKQEKGD